MQAVDFTLAGVDGCKGGWIAVLANGLLTLPRVQAFPRFADILQTCPSLQVIAIDIPIGLLDKEPGERACDKAARAVLGPRRSSVFPAPRRFLLGVSPHAKANELSKSAIVKGLSKQAYNITAKVQDVDATVRGYRHGLVKEVHPEVSFWAMNGRQAMVSNKKTRPGIAERVTLLRVCLGN